MLRMSLILVIINPKNKILFIALCNENTEITASETLELIEILENFSTKNYNRNLLVRWTLEENVKIMFHAHILMICLSKDVDFLNRNIYQCHNHYHYQKICLS